MVTIRCFLHEVPRPLEFTSKGTLSEIPAPTDMHHLQFPPHAFFWTPNDSRIEALHIFDDTTKRNSTFKIIIQLYTHKIVLSSDTNTQISSLLTQLEEASARYQFVVFRTSSDLLVLNSRYLCGVLALDSSGLESNQVAEGQSPSQK